MTTGKGVALQPTKQPTPTNSSAYAFKTMKVTTQSVLTSTLLSLTFGLQLVVGGDLATNTLQKVCTFSNTSSCRLPPANSIVFMGDSTMWKLSQSSGSAVDFGAGPCTITPWLGTCSFAKYMGFTAVNETDWVYPSDNTLGPNIKMAVHPGCTGCSGCPPSLRQCSDPSKLLEYLPVEYARDVEVQTTNGTKVHMSTTQAHVGRYLTDHPRDLCVVNSGLHDAALKDQPRLFPHNVFVYLELIRPGCKHIVWITTSKVRGDKKQPQNNTLIAQADQEVIKLVAPLSGVSVIDVFEESSHWEFADNVHKVQEYYSFLSASIFDRQTI